MLFKTRDIYEVLASQMIYDRGCGMEQNFGLISIIMAAYNAENTIEKAILSVIAQTYTQFELIIINDCSSDQTLSIVKRFEALDKRIFLFNNSCNRGVSYTRRYGLEKARGEWIAILDSDDAWAADKLEKQIRLQKEKNADLIYTGSAFMDSSGNSIEWYLHVPLEIGYRQLLKQNLISNSSALVRKELYMQYYVSEDNMHEDFAIWLGILKTGRKAYGIDEPLLIYRTAKNSKSGNKIKAAKMNWNTYRYIGIDTISSVFYECCYMINGILKYRNLR